jgi:N-acetylmuramoyl-L-alanine amidase
VYVLGHNGDWYHVQLSNGVKGWVLGSYIGMGSSSSTSTESTRPVSPTRAGQPSTATASKVMVSATVSALNVHSTPSTGASVVGSIYKGQKAVVLARSNGWVKVQLPDGTVGWVLASYTSGHGSASKSAGSATKSVSTTKTTSVKSSSAKKISSGVAVNVHRSPSLSATVVATAGKGTSYTVLGWSNNWVHVRLSDGVTGWIYGSVIGALKGSSSKSTSSTKSSTSRTAVNTSLYPHLVTASVRVHATPSLKGKVIGGATAGTRAQVLGYANGFAHANLSNGVSGYVYGSYIR